MTRAALLFVTALLAPRVDAADAGPSLAVQDEGTRESESLQLGEDPSEAEAGRAAIQRALDWLAKEQAQQPDGSLPTTGA